MSKPPPPSLPPQSVSARVSAFVSSGRAWALFPVILLGILVTVQVVLFRMSTNDPSFAVEDDYYQKAVHWDEHQQQKAASERLGWVATATIRTDTSASLLRIELREASGAPVALAQTRIEAFPNARATLVQQITLRETGPGVYEGALNIVYPGLWEFRLTAQRGLEAFTQTLRLDDVGSAPVPLRTTEGT